MHFVGDKQDKPFLIGGGEMGDLIRAKDWRNTPLGDTNTWSQSLLTTLSIILNSRYPMFLFWGHDLLCFYNDAYRPNLGNDGKHPKILGERGEDFWQETWGYIKPLIDKVMEKGESTWHENQLLPIYRNEKIEDVYWTFSYSPAYDELSDIRGVFVTCNETTEKVISQKKLQENKDQLQFAMDSADLGTFEMDVLTNICNGNKRLKEWHGILDEDEFSFELAFQRVMPKERERLAKAIQRSFDYESGGILDLEYFIQNPNSLVQRFVSVKGKAYFGEDKKAYKLSGILTDVTKDVEARQKIEESEERFHTLANNIQNLAWMANSDGWIFWYNQRWYDYTGSTFEEMVGWGWEKVHHPQHVKRVVSFVKEAWNKNEAFELTFPLRGVDGEYKWFLTRVFPITNAEGKVIRWVGTNTDINEQKNAEDQFRLLAETLPYLIWVTDEKGNGEFTSKRWEEYTGLEMFNLDTWKSIVHPDDYDNITHVWSNSLATGNTYTCDARLKSKTGEYRWHTVKGEAVLDDDRKIVKWVGAFTDTHREKTFAQELSRQVESRTKELNKAKLILEEKNIDLEKMNKELESFTYVSSHDLQEPLRKINIFASRLSAHDNDKISDKGKEYLQRMQEAAQRMQQLIQDLLAFSKLSTTDRRFESSNINNLIEEVKNNLKDELQQKEAVIEVSDMQKLNIIPFQFRQLLVNLISNSLKFSKKAVKPLIKIKSDIAKGVDLNHSKLIPDKTYYHITFEDNGIGFESEYNEKIFEVFQRLYSREQYEGTGIGLSIVKKIVENHNGFIDAQSNLGEGATFHIYIPTHL